MKSAEPARGRDGQTSDPQKWWAMCRGPQISPLPPASLTNRPLSVSRFALGSGTACQTSIIGLFGHIEQSSYAARPAAVSDSTLSAGPDPRGSV